MTQLHLDYGNSSNNPLTEADDELVRLLTVPAGSYVLPAPRRAQVGHPLVVWPVVFAALFLCVFMIARAADVFSRP